MRRCRRFFAMLLLVGWATLFPGALAQGVPPPPVITNDPSSLIVLAGSDAVFEVGVHESSVPLSYTWRFFGVNIRGGTNAALKLFNTQSHQVGIYSVVVANMSGRVTSSNASLTVVTGPFPPDLVVRPGEDATFSIQVDGVGPADYQWQFNGQDLAGETRPILNLLNVQSSQAGQYSVTVSNPAGSVTSPEALLTVEAAPRLGYVLWGAQGFHFNITGTPWVTCIIQASKDFAAWTDISTNTLPAGGVLEFIDPDASSFNWRCYRVFQP